MMAGDVSGPQSARSLRLEAGALGAVLVVAAVLAGLNPSIFGGDSGGEGATAFATSDAAVAADASAALALLDDAPPENAEECAGRTVGQANCYRDYFAEVMRNEGADVAVAEIAALSETDVFIARDCHQVVHDLGNDAAEWYGDVGIALTYEGSPCWSGYYHGVVEYAISQFGGTELYDEMPGICETASAVEYSFTHYNCVHGLGHGVMLNLDGDLFGSIPYCEALPDHWELSSCVGGALMENVVSAQQGIATDLRTDDLIYPCNVIGERTTSTSASPCRPPGCSTNSATRTRTLPRRLPSAAVCARTWWTTATAAWDAMSAVRRCSR